MEMVFDCTKNDSEIDSTIGDDVESDAKAFAFSGGRRYHGYKSGKYDLPNDEKEQGRLNLQHYLWIKTLGNELQLSPIPNDLQEVLDIATGTGTWAMDFADAHPSARVIGSDLSPIQPNLVPPNCQFEVDDSEEDWLYHHNFDFIHGRALAVGWRDWEKLCRQAFRFLHPNGWFELQDWSLWSTCDCAADAHQIHPLREYSNVLVGALRQRGITSQDADVTVKRFQEVGFVNVQKVPYKWYIADPMVKQDILNGLEAGAVSLCTKQLGWTAEQVHVWLSKVRQSIIDEKENHMYMSMWVVYGQKP